MGIATNGIVCLKCKKEDDIVLEWKTKSGAKETIDGWKCPACGNNDFYFTDEMGQ